MNIGANLATITSKLELKNYTDFIYRYSVVTQMSDYNNDLVEELSSLIPSHRLKIIISDLRTISANNDLILAK